MTIRIHSHDLLLVAPLWERSNLCGWFGVGKVWLVGNVEILAGYCKCVIDRVRATVSTDSYVISVGEGEYIYGQMYIPLRRRMVFACLDTTTGPRTAGSLAPHCMGNGSTPD
jgi:hypothetical protein